MWLFFLRPGSQNTICMLLALLMGAVVVGPASLVCSGARTPGCGPWSPGMTSSSRLLTVRVLVKEKLRIFNEKPPHKQIIFGCSLVAKQSPPACKTSLWCTGAEAFDLGQGCRAWNMVFCLMQSWFLQRPEEKHL